MRAIATFNQKDVFPDKNDGWEVIDFEDRPTGKAVVFDGEGNIALVGTRVNAFYLLPGGGIDQGESVEDGIIRECLEEIGCEVQLMQEIGVIDDYRNRDKKHCINYCYTAKLVDKKGDLILTEEEEKNGLHVIWVPITKAVGILEKEVEQLKRGEVSFYNTGFNILRDHKFLLEVAKLSSHA